MQDSAALNAVATSLADSAAVTSTGITVFVSGRVIITVPGVVEALKVKVSLTCLPLLPSMNPLSIGRAPENISEAADLTKPLWLGPEMVTTPPTGAGAVHGLGSLETKSLAISLADS